MKAPLQIILISALAFGFLNAEDKKYETLLEYKGVTVREVEKDGIRIMHKSGVAKIPIEELPEEIREELGMSMEGVEDYRKKKAAAQAKKTAAQAEAAYRAKLMRLNKKILDDAYMHIRSATVFQVINGGVLAHVTHTWDGSYREVPTYKTVRVGNRLQGYREERVKSGTKKVKNIERYDNWLIFVSCDNSDFVDGSKFSGDVWQAGRYSYKTALGGSKTIPKYTTNPEDIIKQKSDR